MSLTSTSFQSLLIYFFILIITIVLFFVLKKFILYKKYHLGTFESFLPDYKKIKVDDFEINYIDYGKGPPLVLIHGIGASLYIWRFVVKPLSQNFRIIALDLPGFGLSTKIAKANYGLEAQSIRVMKFLKALEIKKANIIGSSMGGSISLWLCFKFPEYFSRALFLSPATNKKLVPLNLKFIPFKGSSHYFLNQKSMKILQSLVVYNQDLVNQESTHHYLKPYKNDKAAVQTFSKASTELLRDKKMPQCFKGIPTPGKIIWGEHDRLVKKKYIEELHQILPEMELIIDPKSGHHIMEDHPQLVIELAQSFFNEFE